MSSDDASSAEKATNTRNDEETKENNATAHPSDTDTHATHIDELKNVIHAINPLTGQTAELEGLP